MPKNHQFLDLNPQLSDFRSDVIEGLTKKPKQISPKYLYNKRGSDIYEEICVQKEYYPTRTEVKILTERINEISDLIGTKCTMIEFGCGSSLKIRLLLESIKHIEKYVPIDISKEFLLDMSKELAKDYQDIDIMAVCADYTNGMNLSDKLKQKGNRRIIFFPGSTIGNSTPEERDHLLKKAADIAGPGGGLIIGVDLKKNPDLLHAAYNDKKGATSDFNRNLLTRINDELGGSFPLDSFEHKAFYNEKEGRVEMHLVSQKDQTVTIEEKKFQFHKGETIHTECSYKYTVEEFQNVCKNVGFKPEKSWTDENNLFSIHFFSVEG